MLLYFVVKCFLLLLYFVVKCFLLLLYFVVKCLRIFVIHNITRLVFLVFWKWCHLKICIFTLLLWYRNTTEFAYWPWIQQDYWNQLSILIVLPVYSFEFSIYITMFFGKDGSFITSFPVFISLIHFFPFWFFYSLCIKFAQTLYSGWNWSVPFLISEGKHFQKMIWYFLLLFCFTDFLKKSD